MSSRVSSGFSTNYLPGTMGAESLSIALIGPDQKRRKTVSMALAESGRTTNVREFESYPEGPEEYEWLLKQSFNVIVLDLDSDPDLVLDLVERVGASDSMMVMVYSERVDTKLAVRCMRAGAREFLLLPLEEGMVAEALNRAAGIRCEKTEPVKKTAGSLLLFICPKGGCGATTLACNLAIALSGSSEQKTLLVDLALPIGNAALALGIATKYSTEDAIRNADRLDATLLKELLVRHQSGLFVLAAPSNISGMEGCEDAIDKLIEIARREFDHVIVDVGSRMDLTGTALFKKASTVYLVTLSGVSELRNSNRLISQFFPAGGPNLEVVINRFENHLLGGVREDDVVKALGRPVRWKIPEDQESAREMQYGVTGVGNTRISHLSLEMAAAITGHPAPKDLKEKKKGFSLKGSVRTVADERHGNDAQLNRKIAPPAPARLTPVIKWPSPAPIAYGDALSSAQLNATASVAGTLVYTPGPGTVLPAGTHKLSVSFTPADSERYITAQGTVVLEVERSTPAIAWPAPAPIAYGDALSSAQLNATASVAGTLVYTPAPGTVLPAGTHKLSVSFTPADSERYITAQATVALEVERSTPAIAWPRPDPIPYGTPLSAGQLCAAASLPGTFDYAPALGEVLKAGTQTLSATFIPADSANYAPVRATVPLEVSKAIPSIAWPAPHSIMSDIALGDAQLCATSPVPGTFEYAPGPGQVLPVGTHTLSVVFTPTDSENYAASHATVSIKIVEKPAPVVTWTNPDPRVAAGTHTFSVAFNQADSSNYTTTRSAAPPNPAKANPLNQSDSGSYTMMRSAAPPNSTKANPLTDWQKIQASKHGTPLRAPELDAAASAPATLNNSPAHGKVLAPGATSDPPHTEKYKPAQALAKTHLEGLDETSRLPAGPGFQESEPVQKPSVASHRLHAVEKINEVTTEPDWLNLFQEIRPQPDELNSEVSEKQNAARKRWIIAGAGGCSILLAFILAVWLFHSRTTAPVKGTIAPPVAATDTQLNADDPTPSPRRTKAEDETVTTAEAVNPTSAQVDSTPTETESAPVQTGPTSAQSEMMHDQLNEPSRISQEMMQKQVATPPPPSNLSPATASSLGGSASIGSVFAQNAPSVVAAKHGPLAVSPGVAMGLLIKKWPPVYPEIARQARVSGIVQLEATISKAGKIEDLHVVSGPVMLQGAALDAVRGWRYRPYIVDNEPVEIKTTISVAFSLGQ